MAHDWTGRETGTAYYVNLTTGEVEEGRQSSAAHRMGPYDTREAAERAFQTAHERNEEWDAEDRRWDGGDDVPDDKGGAVVP